MLTSSAETNGPDPDFVAAFNKGARSSLCEKVSAGILTSLSNSFLSSGGESGCRGAALRQSHVPSIQLDCVTDSIHDGQGIYRRSRSSSISQCCALGGFSAHVRHSLQVRLQRCTKFQQRRKSFSEGNKNVPNLSHRQRKRPTVQRDGEEKAA